MKHGIGEGLTRLFSGRRLLSVLAVGEGLPHHGPVMDLVVRVLWLHLGFAACVIFALQASSDLEGALRVGKAVLLFLQLGVVIGKLVEQNGDGHAVEDDTKGDAAEGHTAAQVGDGDHVAVAHGGDAHLRDQTRTKESEALTVVKRNKMEIIVYISLPQLSLKRDK